MAIRDVNLDTRQTHIWVSGYQALYPRDDLFPDDDLFPSDRGVYLSNNIVAGTMKLDEIIVDGEQIVFGNLYSNKFEAQIYGEIVVDGETVNVGDYDFSNQFIYVFQEDDGVYKQIFTGKVDSCKRNRDGYDKQIVAYDSAYLYNNQNIAPWWEDFWGTKGEGATATLGELRISLLEYVGVRYSRVVLPNDSISIKKTVGLSSFSFGSCLRMMCEINCCFPHFSRDNILEFVVLDEEANAKNIEDLYEAPSTTFEEFETQSITGIQFLNPDGELKYRVGTDANVYTVNGDNILLLDCDTAQLVAIGTNMLSYVSDLSYRPATIKMVVGDLSYNLGDRLVTSQGTHYILQNSYSGPQFVEQEIRCDGQETIKEAGRTLDTTTLVLNQRIAKVIFDVEHFETEFTEYKTETDGTLSTLSSTITQTAEAISTEVTRATAAEGELSSSITQTAEEVSLKVNKNGVISAINLSSEAATINADKINLTGYVTVTSLQSGGTTQIDGSRITTGTISASRLELTGYLKASDVGSSGSTVISGDRITTGTINAARLAISYSVTGGYIDLDASGLHIYSVNKGTAYESKIMPVGSTTGVSATSIAINTNKLYINARTSGTTARDGTIMTGEVNAKQVATDGFWFNKLYDGFNTYSLASGSFVDKDNKTITVVNGIITDLGF